MNAVEIEQAISELAEQPFDSVNFPFAFLEAFGNKATTIKRLRSTTKTSTNTSDIEGGVLQRSNIHIAVCPIGEVTDTLGKLKTSPKTEKAKAKFILATDGNTLEAEDLNSGDTIACDYPDFPNHFGFFLPLAGISTVRAIRNNPIDIQATSRLNRLYVELLKDNPDWAKEDNRHAMNQFMTRLIFCFFAEDTEILLGDNLFTGTLEQMSDARSDNTQQVIESLFKAMDTKLEDRAGADLPRWADAFPYVNGGLFAGNKSIPYFSRIARSYLLHVGKLDWKSINPDIFGSMIQAVADDDERGELGMHYTSVPNILKVLNPLFLDSLREQLEQAGDNPRKLLNLRKRLVNIRVFDPACGSGNFLVIAYIKLREIEAEIIKRRGDVTDAGEAIEKSWLKLENFYGIELKDFAAEVARLSLLIAEFQCDVRFIGQKEATALVLPLRKTGQIVCGNALQKDWLEVCPPIEETATENIETYICGNPPYRGSSYQTADQKNDLKLIFNNRISNWKNLDYIAGWFLKAADFCKSSNSVFAFVSTNSICQGQQVPILWPIIFDNNQEISFAYTSFKWSNLASHNAGVIVIVVGIAAISGNKKTLYTFDNNDQPIQQKVDCINAYLVPAPNAIIQSRNTPLSERGAMLKGNQPTDGGYLCLSPKDAKNLLKENSATRPFIFKYLGSRELIRGEERYCLWINDAEIGQANRIPQIISRLDEVARIRKASKAPTTRPFADTPHKFRQIQGVGLDHSIVVPSVSSEARGYLPVGLAGKKSIISNLAFALYDAPIWNIALIASKIHLVWVATVCGKLKTDFRYSNTLGWNTFPVPTLTEKNKADLTKCADDILLAREAHYPKTIAELYDPEKMPDNLREAHERNDEVLERIYIGRRFKNDTERLEKLFDLYTKMTEQPKAAT